MPRQIPEAAHSPVIAASAMVANPPDAPAVGVVGLLERTLRALPAEVLALVDLVVTPRGTWREPDPGRAALARVVATTAARSAVTEIGVLQQTAIHRAFDAVARGEARASLVVGVEAKHSSDRRGGVVEADAGLTEPDEIIRPHGDIVHPLEIELGVVAPVQQYALIESALVARAGRSIDAQTRHIAEVWANGSRAVVGRADAWRQRPLAVADVVADTPSNPMLASPYRRAVVSSWTVDQAVAILVTSADRARAAGVADADMVGLVGSATSGHVVPLVARADLTRCPAIGCGATAIARATGRRPAEADLADLYSCFPSAVQVAAEEIGRELSRGWTVTGGMSVYGGPFNSYALHGVATMAASLRTRGPGATGVTTCVSGMLSKASVALWQCGPVEPVLLDVSDDDAREREALAVVRESQLDASSIRAVASTEAVVADGTRRRIEIVEDAGRRRSLRVEPIR